MEELIFYLITFVLVYLLYLFFVILKEKKRSRYQDSTEITFLKKKYKLDIDAIGINKLSHVCALSNAFIIANTVLIIGFIDSYFLKAIVGFIILIPMILIVYTIIGKYYQKKQGKGRGDKNV